MQVKDGEEKSNVGSTSEQDSQDQQEGTDTSESGSASNDDEKEEQWLNFVLLVLILYCW